MNVHVFRREGSSWSLVTPRHTREKFKKFAFLIVVTYLQWALKYRISISPISLDEEVYKKSNEHILYFLILQIY